MRSKLTLCVMLAMVSAAYAKDPKTCQLGTVAQMNSVPCAIAEQAEQGATASPVEIPKTDSARSTSHVPLCQLYLLQAQRVNYLIRPRERHPMLLPVGEPAEFRLQKDKLLLRIADMNSNNKEHAYSVISVTPRSDSSTADAAPPRLNHLQ